MGKIARFSALIQDWFSHTLLNWYQTKEEYGHEQKIDFRYRYIVSIAAIRIRRSAPSR